MSEYSLSYLETRELVSATRAGLYEVFGENSITAKLLLSKIIGNTTLNGLGVVDLSPSGPESASFDQPPRYAERAIRTNDPAELVTLVTEAADRLSQSVPSDFVTTTPEQAAQGEFNLSARRMKGNGTEQDFSLGGLYLHYSPPKGPSDLVEKGHYLAKIEYALNYDAKDWPADAQQGTGAIVNRLTVHQRLLTDPITKRELVSVNLHSGYDVYGGGKPHSCYSGYGIVDPIDAKTKAMMFYYLDEAITYYETLAAREPTDEYPDWIEVETTYKTMMYEYLSRLQDVIAYEDGSMSTAAHKLLASRP